MRGFIRASLALALAFISVSALAAPVSTPPTDLSALNARPQVRSDGTIVALGDSITANAVRYDLTANGSDSWLTKGYFSAIVAASGGRLRPVSIAGWPYTGSGISATGFGACLIAAGGQNYGAGTTASVQSSAGVTGATVGLTITGGVITGCAITGAGVGYLGQAPILTITDPAGTGSGGQLLAQVASAGEFAAGGIGSAEALAYVPLVCASGAQNALVAIGTNDQPRGLTLAQSKVNLVAIGKGLTACGVRPYFIPALERNGAAGAQAQQQAGAIRYFEIGQLATLVPGARVIDLSRGWIDSNDPSSPISTTRSADGLHPVYAGAWPAGLYGWKQMAPDFPISAPLTTGNYGDSYVATYNPTGNLLSTSQALTGSSASSIATPNATTEAPWTGTRFGGLFLSRVAGGTGTGTMAASIVARSDGRPGSVQRLTFNVTGAAAGETLRLAFTGDGTTPTFPVGGPNLLQVGDRIVAAIDEMTLSNVSNISRVALKLVAANYTNGLALTPTAANVTNGRTGTAAWGDWVDPLPAFAGDVLNVRARELVIPASTSFLTLELEVQVNAAGAASITIDLSGASVRRIS